LELGQWLHTGQPSENLTRGEEASCEEEEEYNALANDPIREIGGSF